MEMKAHAYSPSSCGKSDEKPSLIHTRPSRRDGYRLFRLSAGMGGVMDGGARPPTDHSQLFPFLRLVGLNVSYPPQPNHAWRLRSNRINQAKGMLEGL